jgi:hypothetical protein
MEFERPNHWTTLARGMKMRVVGTRYVINVARPNACAPGNLRRAKAYPAITPRVMEMKEVKNATKKLFQSQ